MRWGNTAVWLFYFFVIIQPSSVYGAVLVRNVMVSSVKFIAFGSYGKRSCIWFLYKVQNRSQLKELWCLFLKKLTQELPLILQNILCRKETNWMVLIGMLNFKTFRERTKKMFEMSSCHHCQIFVTLPWNKTWGKSFEETDP